MDFQVFFSISGVDPVSREIASTSLMSGILRMAITIGSRPLKYT
jgi:hypothetical protein